MGCKKVANIAVWQTFSPCRQVRVSRLIATLRRSSGCATHPLRCSSYGSRWLCSQRPQGYMLTRFPCGFRLCSRQTQPKAITSSRSSEADMINSSLLQSKSPKTPCSPPCSPFKQPKQKWYYKFSSKAEEPGKEKWRDASLSDNERWREWHKAKDRERKAGSTTGFLTQFYKGKKGWVW